MNDSNTVTIRADSSFFGDELPLRVELKHEDTGATREYEPTSTDLQDRIDEEWWSTAVDPGGDGGHE
jgi:hypothetical protein